MNTLQDLLVILDGQKLGPGYLTPPKPTALETVIELKKAYDPWALLQNPLPFPQLLMTPAWVGSLGAGKDAIWLDGVDGMLDRSHSQQPAYIFADGGSGGGGGGTPFNAGITSQGSQTGTFSGITSVQITTPKAGTLQSLSTWNETTGGVSMRLGLYADIGDAPGALLASSAIVVVGSGLCTLPVSNGPTLPAGKYWVGSISQPIFTGHFENTGALARFYSSQAWNAGVLPDPFPAAASSGAFAFGFYATLLG